MQQFYTDPTPPCGGRGHGLCSKRMRRSEERTQLWEDLIIGPSDPTPNTKNKAKTKTKTNVKKVKRLEACRCFLIQSVVEFEFINWVEFIDN